MIKFSNFFFQAKKKEAKKSLVTTTATVSQTPQRSFGMRENKRLFSNCRVFRPRLSVIFFFQAKKKEAKKSPGHLRLCLGPRNAFRYVRLFNELRPLTLFLESFLSTFFKNKVGNLQCISRKTNYDTTTTPAKKFFAYFFTKK